MGILLSPYTWLAALVGLIALITTAFYQGYQFRLGEEARDQNALLVKIEHEEQLLRLKQRNAEAQFETQREVIRTVYVNLRKDVNENIEKNTYGNCSLDADGLRLYNARPERQGATTTEPLAKLSELARRFRREALHDLPE